MIKIYGTENEKYINIFETVFQKALAFIGQEEDVEVELSIVSEEEIREINSQTRDINSVTDVLSFPSIDAGKKKVYAGDFPFDINHESGLLSLGEIIICEKRAIEQSVEYGHSVERELGFLCAHGMLHLFGYDHMVEDEEKEMRNAQNQILNSAKLTR